MCIRPVALGIGKIRNPRVPCGQCIECRLKRSREWALRCMHEASLYEANAFVTLTYAEEYLPVGGSLDRRAFPLFMKRLRKEVGRVRYFHSGEYGEENGRPHYHALLFGVWPSDAVGAGYSKSGYPVFTSETLSGVWSLGAVQLGSVQFESAQYVARYCLEKVTGSRAAAHYQRVDDQGWVYQLEPEYATMSRGNGIVGDPGRFGIGYRWYEKFREEVYRDDSVMCRGAEVSPPRFYDKKEEEREPERMKVLKEERLHEAEELSRIAKGVTHRTSAAREAMIFAKLAMKER